MRLHVVLRLEQQRSDLGKPQETLFSVNTVAETEWRDASGGEGISGPVKLEAMKSK